MKETDYRQWLESQDYQEKTITAQIYSMRRVEEFHGDPEKRLRLFSLNRPLVRICGYSDCACECKSCGYIEKSFAV